LVLNENLKAGAHSGDDDLDRFGVKIAAEPLKVSAQEHDGAAQILFAESRSRFCPEIAMAKTQSGNLCRQVTALLRPIAASRPLPQDGAGGQIRH